MAVRAMMWGEVTKPRGNGFASREGLSEGKVGVAGGELLQGGRCAAEV